jgi:hypothetical protein
MPKSTPSSLKWLISKQTRLAGRVADAEARRALHLAEAEALGAHAAELRRQLALVEGTMSLHEIQIDPEDLRVIRPQGKRLMKAGRISQIIFKTIAESPDRKAATPEIVAAVLAALPDRPTLPEHYRVQAKVQVRLCTLANQGRLIKHETGHRKMPRVWELPPLSSVGP